MANTKVAGYEIYALMPILSAAETTIARTKRVSSGNIHLRDRIK